MHVVQVNKRTSKKDFLIFLILGSLLIFFCFYSFFISYNIHEEAAIGGIMLCLYMIRRGIVNPNKSYPLGTIKNILIDNHYITISPVNNEDEKEVIINKREITEFNANIIVNEKYVFFGGRQTNMSTTMLSLYVKLKNGQEYIYDNNIDPELFRASFEFVYELLKCSSSIPHCSINVSSTNETNGILAKIDYFKKYGKKMPFWKTRGWLEMHLITRIFIIVISIAWVIAAV